jgi:hypothetical protein
VESHQEMAYTPQIRCSCSFSEPPIDWFNQISRLIDSFLPPPKLCEAHVLTSEQKRFGCSGPEALFLSDRPEVQ